jgi:hypothetical protein
MTLTRRAGQMRAHHGSKAMGKTAEAADGRGEVVLTRSQLVREPLGGRTWRGALTNLGDRLHADVAVDIRFIDRNGRAVGGLGGRVARLAPGAGLELQSRLPTGATGLRIQSLRWTADGGRVELGPYEPLGFG